MATKICQKGVEIEMKVIAKELTEAQKNLFVLMWKNDIKTEIHCSLTI